MHAPDDRLLTRTFFKLLPYQMLMIAISSVNSIVDSLPLIPGRFSGNCPAFR